jgi:multiple sugar transport system ATP-binding protein
MNFLPVEVERVERDTVMVASDVISPIPVRGRGFAVGDRAVLGVRPHHLTRDAAQEGDGRLGGRISLVERLGTETIVSMEARSGERVLAVIPGDIELPLDNSVMFSFDPALAHVYPDT